ncbi:SNF2 family N-terminal domain-containing protein [Gymnopilus junonius]|uniref:SNF2 family N-terminal domain-containing protein n=1 Tax=Gymnopilus junonius TaxID=109634 RepID=A0A9P5ND81_GYMJU|nr:SNF2 family N-terminal domain-containing protein [Gymnopilus junonius]
MSSPNSSSPASFSSDEGDSTSHATSPRPSTAPSTPPPHALSDYSRASSEVDESLGDDTDRDLGREPVSMQETEMERRLARLQFVLQKSQVYSSILHERMEEEKTKQIALQAQRREEQAGKKRSRPVHSSPRGKKKKGARGEAVPTHEEAEVDNHEDQVFQQPALVNGAKLKSYQLEGLQWMVSLDQNGISGILGINISFGQRTLQAISFSAYLREHGNYKPFLVVCPLSVLHNWYDEYKKFAPDIPVCIYHGTPADRAELRRTVMARPGPSKLATRTSTKTKLKRKGGRPRKPRPETVNGVRRSGRPRKSTVVIESESENEDDKEYKPEDVDDAESMQTEDDEEVKTTAKVKIEKQEYSASFPVVLTTYEMIIKDRQYLCHYDWGYIVVDEGHRLKNLDCKLMQEIKKYTSAGRMILTGTPLQNNLAELWALLNFILPDIFDDLDTFQQWFNLPELQSNMPTSQTSQIISSLHAILKPFLLRRLKVDVETNLPPKKEYVLYAPLTVRQREAYNHILDGGLRQWLIQGGTGTGHVEIVPDADKVEVLPAPATNKEKDESPQKRRASKRLSTGRRKSYHVDGDDDEYFKMVECGEVDERGVKVLKSQKEKESEEAKIGKEHLARAKTKQVNNMKLQNTVMQLRKVCSHPFLFDWPIDPETMYPILGEELVNASGKMMVLDRLLRELFRRGHKVLLFSQFTTMLDIIQDWAVDFMGWPICRIDGQTSPLERREQMNIFQTGGSDPKNPQLFLLSTRAGGLGINLTAADTVIFYDQDWNPQMDAQAQDRAHRIGQTRPVLIFRLVSAHTVETKIMERATSKRKLEALVIAKERNDGEMAAELLRLEGEKIDVVPTPRRASRAPAVFAERGQGQGEAEGAPMTADGPVEHAAIGAGKKAAFAVYQAPVEEGNDALGKMMGEEEAQ